MLIGKLMTTEANLINQNVKMGLPHTGKLYLVYIQMHSMPPYLGTTN